MADKFQLSLEVAGDDLVVRGFSRLADGVTDLRPAWEAIGKDFENIERQQFASQGGYGSGGWEPLQESTVKEKQRKGYPTDILVRTGALRDSLAGQTEHTIRQIEALSLTLGTDINYAIYHYKGSPKTNLPARPEIQLTEDDKTRWTKIIQVYLVQLARSAFAGLMPTIGEGKSVLRSFQL